MKLRRKVIGVLLGVVFTHAASANHSCPGVITAIDMSSNGTAYLTISGIGSALAFCSVASELGTYSPESCKGNLSLLMSAYLAGKPVRLWFNNDANSSCNKGSWVALKDHGLYHMRIEN